MKAAAPDRLPAQLRLDRALLQRLSRPAPLRLLGQVALEWTWIAAAVALALHADSVAASLLAILFIGTRQHALLMLMHEFSHRQFSRTRPVLNDTLGDVFTALPFLITLHGFRRNHLRHHRAPCTEEDPNWMSSIRQERYRVPRSRARMAWLLMWHGLGAYALQDLKGYLFEARMAIDNPPATRCRQALFALAAVGLTWACGAWLALLVYWFVPMLTVLMLLLYLRDLGEHFALPAPGLEASRTVLAGRLEAFFIAPHAVGFHAEHHLYPSVPFCRLRELHLALRERPAYARHAVVTRGYLGGLLDEVARARPLPEAALRARNSTSPRPRSA